MNIQATRDIICEFQDTASISKKCRLFSQLGERFCQDSLVQGLSFSTKKQIKQFINTPEEERIIYAPLCPIYDNDQISVENYKVWSDLPKRFQVKADKAMEAISLITQCIPSRVNLLLADRGILLPQKIPSNELNRIIEQTIQLYARRIYKILGDVPFEIQTFTDLNLPIEQISVANEGVSKRDINNLLRMYDIDPEKFKFQSDIIIQAFGLGNAYNLIKNYLEENEFFIQNFENTLFLNTEFCRPLNTLYTASRETQKRINQNNVFAPLNLNSNNLTS
ncbi:hypothetical protein CSB09_01775 [Candidatus Gracilibacteria bacterium]|nr:MAG: hypothetical protein CSB09_01775 [Candidatus Gracilibacteria bacterium]